MCGKRKIGVRVSLYFNESIRKMIWVFLYYRVILRVKLCDYSDLGGLECFLFECWFFVFFLVVGVFFGFLVWL